MTFVALPRPGAPPLYVNPGTVDVVADLAPSAPPLSLVSFIGEGGETRETVSGTAAAVAALLDAGMGPPPPSTPIAFGGYGPPGTALSGPISLIAGFAANWSQIGNVVTLSARFEVTFASSGTCSFSFPSPIQAPLAMQLRGAVSYSDNPYTGAPNADPEAICYESGTDIVVEFGNGTGGPKRFSIVCQYLTP
jgi:hypothetical protein